MDPKEAKDIEVTPHPGDKVLVLSILCGQKMVDFYTEVRFVYGFNIKRMSWRVQVNTRNYEDDSNEDKFSETKRIQDVYVTRPRSGSWELQPDNKVPA